jgi:cytochrome oxidase Cu insertion factor (SCO1/SenC/PrrC family)
MMTTRITWLRALGLGAVGLSAGTVAYVSSRDLKPTADTSRVPSASARGEPAEPTAPPTPTDPAPMAGEIATGGMSIPDVVLVDQCGKPVRFYSHLVRGRRVAINYIFTTCQGVCPPLSTTFGKLGARLEKDGVRFISVSVDPVNDTPERLAAWGKRFGAGPNWTLVTGDKREVDRLLKALDAYNPDKTRHPQLVLLGDDRLGRWRRVPGLATTDAIAGWIAELGAADGAATGPAGASGSAAREYFTDVTLTDQDGRPVRLYSDLIRGKVVIIHVFFSTCKGSCPRMLGIDRGLQDHLGDRLGRDVHLISLTVDPANDLPEGLRDLSRRMGARPGWFLLSGPEENVRFALRKLGLSVRSREDHSNLFIIGNDQTGLWTKVQSLRPVEEIARILDGVLEDRGDVPIRAVMRTGPGG